MPKKERTLSATSSDAKKAKSKRPGSSEKKATKGKQQPSGGDQIKELWQCRMYKAREWGHKLDKQGGSHQATVKRLLETLKDGRILTEQSLRRTALQALTPAASVGHRGALEAQAKALMDRSKVVRECALDSLWEAAGSKRPEEGGAVHSMLTQVLPPEDARYKVESRRAAADALMRLAPKGDQHLLSTARKWLKDEDAEVRFSATQATGLLGEGLEDVETIAAQLQDGNWKVARAAVEALERLSGGEEGIRCRCKPRMLSRRSSLASDSRLASMSSSRRGSKESKVFADSPSQMSERASKSSISMSQSLPSIVGATPEDSPTAADAADPLASTFPISSSTGDKKLADGKDGKKGKRSRRASNVLTHLPGLAEEDAKEEEEEDPGDPDGMPRPSEWHLAATAALSETCLGGGPVLRGLPRADAVRALRRVAPWGDLGALQGAAFSLRDTDAEVRREAVAAVAALEPGDHVEAIRSSCASVEELDWRARASAVEALASCADPNGDSEAFECAAACLEGPEWGARRGGVAALRVLSSTGDKEHIAMALEAVNSRLSHEHWSVRRKAVVAVGSICESSGGDLTGLKMLRDMMEDPDEEVRCAIAATLPRTAPNKSKEAVSLALRLAMDDDDADVRLQALASLERLCSVERCRTRKAPREVASLLADASEEVRLAAQRVLRSIACGRRTAIDALAKLLSHPDEKARLIAADTFMGVAEARQDRAMKRTSKLLRHSDEGVRAAASNAVSSFSEGQESAVIHAAASVVERWRRGRFTNLRGHLLSKEERRQNFKDRGEDPNKDKEWEKMFGEKGMLSKVSGKKSLKTLNRKHKNKKAKSDTSSSALTSRATSEAGDSTMDESDMDFTDRGDDDQEETEVDDDSDDGAASQASRLSKATDSSRTSKMTSESKTSKGASSKSSVSNMGLKGKAAQEYKAMQAAAEKEKKRIAAEKKKRQKELEKAMETSSEEELSESATEEENDDGDFFLRLNTSKGASRGAPGVRRTSVEFTVPEGVIPVPAEDQ